MSLEALNLLCANEDIVQLKEIIKQDPIFKTIKEQLPIIEQCLNGLYGIGVPTLDLNEVEIKQANLWITKLQKAKDDLVRYESIVKTYQFHVDRYWTLAFNICLTQPVVEGMKSAEQRRAHVERLFEDLVNTKETLNLTASKIKLLNENLQSAYYNFTAQQKSLQMLVSMNSGAFRS